jgi:hypothetical protein
MGLISKTCRSSIFGLLFNKIEYHMTSLACIDLQKSLNMSCCDDSRLEFEILELHRIMNLVAKAPAVGWSRTRCASHHTAQHCCRHVHEHGKIFSLHIARRATKRAVRMMLLFVRLLYSKTGGIRPDGYMVLCAKRFTAPHRMRDSRPLFKG